MSDFIKEFHSKIEKNFVDSTEKCDLICTLLGTSANLAEFVLSNVSVSDVPSHIQYCILITSVNMMGMLNDECVFEKVDLNDNIELNISEQSQEHIYRKMKKCVEIIIQEFKRQEVENEL